MEILVTYESKFKSCVYSNKLLTKLLNLNKKIKNKIDLNEVEKAIYYAKKYHHNQKRLSGEPYYTHPIEVAYMVSDYLPKNDIIITSILHDLIEDTCCTQQMITSIFGLKIANQVQDLTRIKEHGKISSAELVEILWLEKKYELLVIKEFDRLHNMLTISHQNPEKIKKITNETIETFIILAAYLEIVDVEKKLVEICKSIINTNQLTEEEAILPFGNDENLISILYQSDINHK